MPKPKLNGRRYERFGKSLYFLANAIDVDIGVKHFTEAELEVVRVVADAEGRAVYAVERREGRLDTSNGGEWMYVMDIHGNFYVALRVENKVFHSSLGGPSTAAAGVIQIKEGVIRSIDEESGHYRLTNHMLLVEVELWRQGFDCESINFKYSPYDPIPDASRMEERQKSAAAAVAAANKKWGYV